MQLDVHPIAEHTDLEDIYVTHLIALEDAGDGMTRYMFGKVQGGLLVPKVPLVTGPTLVWHTIRCTMTHFGRKCCGARQDRLTH